MKIIGFIHNLRCGNLLVYLNNCSKFKNDLSWLSRVFTLQLRFKFISINFLSRGTKIRFFDVEEAVKRIVPEKTIYVLVGQMDPSGTAGVRNRNDPPGAWRVITGSSWTQKEKWVIGGRDPPVAGRPVGRCRSGGRSHWGPSRAADSSVPPPGWPGDRRRAAPDWPQPSGSRSVPGCSAHGGCSRLTHIGPLIIIL